jgi:peptidoglycan/LPS O-acetylase OafA/YrhL
MVLEKIRRITRDGRWIPEIDGLRFIAISSVVLFHLAGEMQQRSGRIIPIEPRYAGIFWVVGNGDRGVRLFFVISGMILAMPFARHYLAGAKKVSLRKYYMRRVTRLEPPYILAAIIFTMMVAVFLHGRLEPGYWQHALATMFYVHNVTYGMMSPMNPVTWSLEVEIQFYLLAPLVMLLFNVSGLWIRRALLATIILALGLAQAPVREIARVNMSILFYLQYFLAGLLLADVFVLDLERMPSTWGWDIAGLAGLAFMFGMGHDVYAAHLLLPFVLAIVCLAAMRGLVLRKFVSNPWIAVIGGMCYSIYLLHFALMAMFFKVTRYAIQPGFDFLTNFAIQLVVTCAPILLVSVLYYLLVERPCMDPDWPSKLWHKITGRSGNEVEILDASGVSESS